MDSGAHKPTVSTSGQARAVRDNRGNFLGLAMLVAILGAASGALVAHSWLTKPATGNHPALAAVSNAPAINKPPANRPATNKPAANAPANNAPANKPAPPRNEPAIEPDPPHRPQTEPEPAIPADALLLHWSEPGARFRFRRGTTELEGLQPGQYLQRGDRAQISAGLADFRAGNLRLLAPAGTEFTWRPDESTLLHFHSGKPAVACSDEHTFGQAGVSWRGTGQWVLEHSPGGSLLLLLQGEMHVQRTVAKARALGSTRVLLGGTLQQRALTDSEIRQCEATLQGPARILYAADFESDVHEFTQAERAMPGALGSAGCLRRRSGSRGLIALEESLFVAEAGARIQMRVKTTSPRLRLVLRRHEAEGWRDVQAFVPVPMIGQWCAIDLPLEALRGGKHSELDGLLPGAAYGRMQINFAQDYAAPFRPHELLVDDISVYVPK